MSPKVSVITVAYNAAATIADTLRSVAAQRYPNVEHIVVDGASTDDTLAVVERYSHDRLTVRSEPDSGLYDAMNKGLSMSTGDLIGFLNADDFICRTDAFDLLIATAEYAPDAAAISGGVAIVDAVAPDRVRRSYSACTFRPWMLRFAHMPPHPGFYMRREVLERVGLFNPELKIGADFEWMLRFFHVHRLRSAALRQTIVALREGGLSTRGLQSMRIINREALASMQRHGLWSNAPVVWSKYAIKSAQFLSAPFEYPAPIPVRWMPNAGEAALC